MRLKRERDVGGGGCDGFVVVEKRSFGRRHRIAGLGCGGMALGGIGLSGSWGMVRYALERVTFVFP